MSLKYDTETWRQGAMAKIRTHGQIVVMIGQPEKWVMGTDQKEVDR